MRRAFLAGLMTLALVATLSAAGSVAVTVNENVPRTFIYTIAWTSDASGNVTGNASNTWGLTASTVYPLMGHLKQVKFIPGSGATQPTDLYDVTLVDSDGASLLVINGVDYGANQSNATPLLTTMEVPIYLDASKTIDVRVANAGNAKTGTVKLWIER